MVMSFDAEEMELMQKNQLSSVFREVKNVRLPVETFVSNLGHDAVSGKVIVYTGDCMPAIQDLKKIKGSVNVFPEVKQLQLFLFAASHDLHFDFIWESKESDALLHADILSCVEDSSEIFLSRAAFKQVCMQLSHGHRWGFPTLDVFLGELRVSTKCLGTTPGSTPLQVQSQQMLCIRIGGVMHVPEASQVCFFLLSL